MLKMRHMHFLHVSNVFSAGNVRLEIFGFCKKKTPYRGSFFYKVPGLCKKKTPYRGSFFYKTRKFPTSHFPPKKHWKHAKNAYDAFLACFRQFLEKKIFFLEKNLMSADIRDFRLKNPYVRGHKGNSLCPRT